MLEKGSNFGHAPAELRHDKALASRHRAPYRSRIWPKSVTNKLDRFAKSVQKAPWSYPGYNHLHVVLTSGGEWQELPSDLGVLGTEKRHLPIFSACCASYTHWCMGGWAGRWVHGLLDYRGTHLFSAVSVHCALLGGTLLEGCFRPLA